MMVNVLVTIPIHHSGSCKYAKPPVAAPLLQIDATWSSEKMCDVVHCSVQSKLATWHSPIHKTHSAFLSRHQPPPSLSGAGSLTLKILHG
jgi:hypothetical protein